MSFDSQPTNKEGEALVLCEYLVQQGKMSPQQVIDFESAFFGFRSYHVLLWQPQLIFRTEVNNAASENAAEMAGFFFANPEVLWHSVGIGTLFVDWGLWN